VTSYTSAQTIFSGVMVVTAGFATPATAQVLKREPSMGQLREGETVLVNDGTCPKGRIK
jgi:hypothetical protein